MPGLVTTLVNKAESLVLIYQKLAGRREPVFCSVTGRLHGVVSVRGQRKFPKRIYRLASERLGKKMVQRKKWSWGWGIQEGKACHVED